MKQLILFAGILFYSFLFSQCSSDSDSKDKTADEVAIAESDLSENDEKEDGIRESMEMEFEMTRDIKLGYIPADRLVMAYNKLLQDRRAGRVERVSALSWTERGSNSDVVGPGNGNTRGPGNNAVTSGRMRAILVDLADATNKTVWVGSVSGGLWKTTDITAASPSWQIVNDFLGNLAIASICQNPANTNIMYFATGERNGNVDAVRGGGVWKSTDHGVTWNLLANTTGFWNASKIVCDAAGNVYVGTSGNNNGLQRSVDGGATWTNITPATPASGNRITELRISSTGRMHVTMLGAGGTTAAPSGYFYTDNPSTVTDASWTAPNTPFLNVQYNCELAVAGNTLYVLPSDGNDRTPQIYKSTDGGANWAATVTSPPGGASEPTINAGQGWYDLAIGVDPANPNIVIAGGLNYYRSIDGGLSWSQLTRWVGTTFNYVHADHHTVVWNGTQVLTGTDGGIFYSSDNGASFSDRNTGLRLKQFYSCAVHPTTSNYFLAGAQDNGTHQFTNPGLGSSIEVLGGDGGFVHIDQDEPLYQFGSTTRGQYRRSTNGGSSWSSVNYSSSIGQFINPTDYDDINNRMYTSASAGTYVRWENPQTGSNFSSVSIAAGTSGSVMSIKVSPYTSNLVYFGASNGRIVKVDNAHTASPTVTNITGTGMPGSTVSSINLGTGDNLLIASYSNYGAAHVWMSSTGGGTGGWTNISGNLPDIPVRWAMFYPENNDKAIIATDMGIYETDDINGASTVWVQNSTFPTVRTNMLQYRQKENTLLAATHGRGLWTTTIVPAAPYIRFAAINTYSITNTENTAVLNGCRSYKDYTVNMQIDAAPAGNAAVTVSIAGGGTAVQGADFDFTTNGNFTTPSNVITFLSGSTAEQPITIRVYDDAEIETAESFTFNYSVGGGTNAIAAPSSQSYTFTISDNDLPPVPEGVATATLGTGNYGSYVQPFRGTNAKARSQYIYTADELLARGFIAGDISALGFNVTTKGSTIPYTGLTISLKNTTSSTISAVTGFESGTTSCYSNTYSTVSGINTFTFATPFSWDGVSNLLVEICYDNSDNTGTADDFVTSNSTTTQKGVWGRVNSGVAGCTISSGLFDGVGTPATYVRPDFILTGLMGNSIETGLNTNKTLSVAGAGVYYFLTAPNNKIINSITGSSANLGCVSSTISEAGNTWQNIYAGQRSQKVFDVALTTNNAATYTIGLYYTAAELGGKTPGAIKIAGTTAATMAGANSSNTTIAATSFTPFGTGYLFTASVTGSGKYFLVEDNATGLFNPANRPDNFVRLLQNPVGFSIPLFVNNESRANVSATLFTNTGQLLKKWDLGRTDGNVILPFSGSLLTTGTYLLRIDAGNKTQSFKLIKQ